MSFVVYHGRKSFEIGVEIIFGNELYYISEIMELIDKDAAKNHKNFVATTAPAVRNGLNRAAMTLEKYAKFALEGDKNILAALRRQREDWGKQLRIETELASIKPKAEEAFRQEKYEEADRLFDKIRLYLTPAGLKKASITKNRAKKGNERLQKMEILGRYS